MYIVQIGSRSKLCDTKRFCVKTFFSPKLFIRSVWFFYGFSFSLCVFFLTIKMLYMQRHWLKCFTKSAIKYVCLTTVRELSAFSLDAIEPTVNRKTFTRRRIFFSCLTLFENELFLCRFSFISFVPFLSFQRVFFFCYVVFFFFLLFVRLNFTY